MRSLISITLCLVSFGCAHADVAEEPASEDAPAQRPPDENVTPEAATAADNTEADQTEAEMRARAEAFVRAQGYADTPGTVAGDHIVHEGIEGTIEMRRNTLDPVPASGGRADDGTWSFTFRYIDPQYAGRGRMLVMRPGQPPRFVHQDLVFPQ